MTKITIEENGQLIREIECDGYMLGTERKLDENQAEVVFAAHDMTLDAVKTVLERTFNLLGQEVLDMLFEDEEDEEVPFSELPLSADRFKN